MRGSRVLSGEVQLSFDVFSHFIFIVDERERGTFVGTYWVMFIPIAYGPQRPENLSLVIAKPVSSAIVTSFES